uniref:Uncharacterized protein n=1 Tax=Nelumbo nucifera TaxID=4432 RepID=A0A822ZPG6_NELNU|nr:TPA_asm: hypothetical protein HUJ06_003661 [Nelumbo nucifera]
MKQMLRRKSFDQSKPTGKKHFNCRRRQGDNGFRLGFSSKKGMEMGLEMVSATMSRRDFEGGGGKTELV